MKKPLLILAALSAMSLAACSGSSDPQPTQFSGKTLEQAFDEQGLTALDRSDNLHGADSNSDGIRDDVEAYIESQPGNAAQKLALRQTAKNFAAVLIASESAPDDEEASALAIDIARSAVCLSNHYGMDFITQKQLIKNAVLNTTKRYTAYYKAQTIFSGTNARLPEPEGACDDE